MGVGAEFQAEGIAGEMVLRSHVPGTVRKDEAQGGAKRRGMVRSQLTEPCGTRSSDFTHRSVEKHWPVYKRET